MRRSARWSLGGVAAAALLTSVTLPGAFAVTPSHNPGGAGPKAGKTPPFFTASMSWVDSKDAWLLGSGGCTTKPCSGVKTSTDGGKTWNIVGSVPAHMLVQGKPKNSQVGEIRMADMTVGWAYLPLLYTTSDGGATWSQQTIPGGNKQVLSLTADSSGAWLVASPCSYESGPCKKPLSVWHSDVSGRGSWTKIDLTLPTAFGADVDAFGTSVYVVVPQLEEGKTDLLYASTDGTTFTARSEPCDDSQDIGLVQAVATSTTNVYLLCDGDPGMSEALKSVYGSTDNAMTLTDLGQMGALGIQAQLAASKSGNLAVASSSDGSFIYINDTKGGTTWSMPVGLSDGGIGWGDIAYTTNTTAWVVYAPAGGFMPRNVLYKTTDAGHTWNPSHP